MENNNRVLFQCLEKDFKSGLGRRIDLTKCAFDSLKPNVNAFNNEGNTPIICAILNISLEEQLPIIEFLIEKGADINLQNRNGKTPLDIATANRNKEIVSLLEQQQIKDNIAAAMKEPEVVKSTEKEDFELINDISDEVILIEEQVNPRLEETSHSIEDEIQKAINN